MDQPILGVILHNKLLGALPAHAWARVERHLAIVETRPGEILSEAHVPLDYGYFPITSIISLQHVTADGASIEVAAVDDEGVVGVNLFLGDGTTPNRLVVQNRGQTCRLKREFLQAEFNRGGALQRLLLGYTQKLLAQLSQTSVCNQRHSIDQQLCRWLLQTLDRLCSQEVMITHELLANTLGVRREGITESARKLHRAGIITYQRGRVVVIDRVRLEARCCECYAVMRRSHHGVPGPHSDPLARLPLTGRQITLRPAVGPAIGELNVPDESLTPI
ncbi:MAG: Crp/Fnr family transcriptional regulator [Steroidobacteraceae bacterium]